MLAAVAAFSRLESLEALNKNGCRTFQKFIKVVQSIDRKKYHAAVEFICVG